MENTGVNERFFVRMLNDHCLSQLNHIPSRGNNILDLVIKNVPDNVDSDTISTRSHLIFLLLSGNRENQSELFMTIPKRIWKVYLLHPFQSLVRLILIGSVGRILFFRQFLEYIPKTKLSGCNPLPWIHSSILHLIKKKESVRRRLKAKPIRHLQEKFKRMRSIATR